MDVGRTARIACLTLGMLPTLFAGTALAEVRSGSVADETDDSTTDITGIRVADVRSVESRYDDSSGTLSVTFRLTSALPTQFSADASARVGQSYDKDGNCSPRAKAGDVDLEAYFARYDDGSYGGASLEGNGISSSRGNSSATSDTVTMSFSGAALVRRDYRCLTGLSLNLYSYDRGATSVDTVRGFHFDGFAPPPPPPNPVTGPLKVSWNTPKARETVSGFLWSPRALKGAKLCEVRVEAAAGVDHVDFSVDGQFLNREYNSPYRCIWDTRKVADGQHALTATAYDKAGKSTIATIGLNVRNAGVSTVVPPPERPDGVLLRPLPVTTGQAPTPAPVAAAPGSPPQATAPAAPGAGSGPTRTTGGARVSFAVLTKSLRSVRAGGLLVPVRCSTGCRVSLALVRGRKVVGRGRGALSRRGRRVVTVRLTRGGRRAVRRVRRGTFVVRGTVRDAGGNVIRIQRRIQLRR